VTTMTAARTWTLAIPAPAAMQTANRREHWRAVARRRKTWREAAYLWAAVAKLPRGLARVRIDVELRFTTNRRRDAPNYYSEVIKPCVDALTPAREVRSRGSVRVEPGWGLIPDDTEEFLDLGAPRIGPTVSRVLYPYGLVVFTITDLSEEGGADA
jgi:hypothetical protein